MHPAFSKRRPGQAAEGHDGREASPALLHIPPAWAEGAARIRRDGIRSALVLGAIDAGKSTLCRFLADEARQAGRSAALLDADLGQKTVGPPACVTMEDPHGLKLAFAGTTNPVLGWSRLMAGIQRLAHATDADFIVTNTSGLLAGPGRKLKAAKIALLRPDLLIALGDGPDLDAILGDHSGATILRLPASVEAKRKTDGQRRAARREAFRRYFAKASTITVEGSRLALAGLEMPPPMGLLLGLSDAGSEDLGLGVLKGCAGPTRYEILTPVAPGSFNRIVPGSLCLDEAFSEIGMKAPG